MKRAILAALAAMLLTTPVLAAPPPDAATLTLVSIDPNCEASRGCLNFLSEPDKPKGGPNRHLVQVEIYADWALGGIAQSGTAEIDGDGLGTFFYRNGTHGPSGTPYSQSFCAWVALDADHMTPISPVVCGDL